MTSRTLKKVPTKRAATPPGTTKGDARETGRTSATTPKPAGDAKRQLSALWGEDIIKARYLVIPKVLLFKQRELGLSAEQLNVLLHLLKHWFEKDRLPHPAKRSIADAMGVTPRTVQKHLAAMENQGILRRISRSGTAKDSHFNQTNEYSFEGLLEKLRPLAREIVLSTPKNRGNE